MQVVENPCPRWVYKTTPAENVFGFMFLFAMSTIYNLIKKSAKETQVMRNPTETFVSFT